jgi:hypothetical protein
MTSLVRSNDRGFEIHVILQETSLKAPRLVNWRVLLRVHMIMPFILKEVPAEPRAVNPEHHTVDTRAVHLNLSSNGALGCKLRLRNPMYQIDLDCTQVVHVQQVVMEFMSLQDLEFRQGNKNWRALTLSIGRGISPICWSVGHTAEMVANASTAWPSCNCIRLSDRRVLCTWESFDSSSGR